MTAFCVGDLFMFHWSKVACHFTRSFVYSVDQFFLQHGLLFPGSKRYFYSGTACPLFPYCSFSVL